MTECRRSKTRIFKKAHIPVHSSVQIPLQNAVLLGISISANYRSFPRLKFALKRIPCEQMNLLVHHTLYTRRGSQNFDSHRLNDMHLKWRLAARDLNEVVAV